MARSFSKKRCSSKRKPKPLILLIAEGKNVTESQYFQSFQKQYNNYNIKILIPGSTTDPAGMLEIIERYWYKNDMSAENGDIGFVVLDLDCDDEKAKLIKQLGQKNSEISFVVSNPCFEVWFMLHFRYSTHSYNSSAAAVKDLKTLIPEYKKNLDISSAIAGNLDDALKNVERLRKYYESIGADWPSNACNPMTDVPTIIDVIKKRESNC